MKKENVINDNYLIYKFLIDDFKSGFISVRLLNNLLLYDIEKDRREVNKNSHK